MSTLAFTIGAAAGATATLVTNLLTSQRFRTAAGLNSLDWKKCGKQALYVTATVGWMLLVYHGLEYWAQSSAEKAKQAYLQSTQIEKVVEAMKTMQNKEPKE